MNKKSVCCYCNKEIVGFKNNPNDYSSNFYKKYAKNDVCCDKCYNSIVIPKKMKNTIVPNIKM